MTRGVYAVEVAVALRRPPRPDATIYYQLAADTGLEAELIACMWAYCHRRVSMPVASVVTDWPQNMAQTVVLV